jgi:predicted dehydrogenase
VGLPTDTPPVPSGLNWDLWLGPREPRPYSPAYVPVKWRDFWAFGASNLGDFGCHDMDAACWALDLQAPLSVEARTTGPMTADIAGHGSMVFYEFGSRGNKPPVRLTWYDGGLRPERPAELPEDVEFPSRGVLFVGEKGLMLCGGAGGKPQLLPESLMDGYKAPAPSIVRSKGHHRDWLDAIKGGAPASSNFEYGARLTELVLIGVLATRLGKTIRWDPAKLEARGVPEAEPLIHGTYRKGWEVG